jgi:hypothetical protein
MYKLFNDYPMIFKNYFKIISLEGEEKFLQSWNPAVKSGYYSDAANRRKQMLKIHKTRFQQAKVIDILGYKTDGGQSGTDMEKCVKNVFLQSVSKGYCSERELHSNVNLTGVVLPFDFSKLYKKKETQNLLSSFLDPGLDFPVNPQPELNDDGNLEEMKENNDDPIRDISDSEDMDDMENQLDQLLGSAEFPNSIIQICNPTSIPYEERYYLNSSSKTEKSGIKNLEYQLPFYTNLSQDNLKDLSISHNYPYMFLEQLEIKRQCPKYTRYVTSLAVFAHVLPLNSYDCLDFMNDMKTVDQVLSNNKLPPVIKNLESIKGFHLVEFDHQNPQMNALKQNSAETPKLVAWIKLKDPDLLESY